MKIGFSTSVIQRGKTGVAQYVFALLRAFRPHAQQHQFYLFVLEEDRPLFDFAKDAMTIVTVPEQYRPAVKNVLWHQTKLPALVRSLGLDVLHVLKDEATTMRPTSVWSLAMMSSSTPVPPVLACT